MRLIRLKMPSRAELTGEYFNVDLRISDKFCFRYDLSSFQEGLVVSSALLGGMVGSIFTATLGSKLGRKAELLLASVLYGLSSFRRKEI